MLNWLRSRFRAPTPAGPAEPVRTFSSADATVSRDVTAAAGGFMIDASGATTVALFELHDPGVEGCVLSYRAQLRSEALQGRAYLEMWCRLPGRGEFFSKGLQQALSGSNDWTSRETPFLLKKGQRPDLIKLNVTLEGGGRLWLKDIELLATPLA